MALVKEYFDEFKWFIIPATIFIIVFGVFTRTVFNGFVYDDEFAILYNRYILKSINPIVAFQNPNSFWYSNTSIGNYRPIWTWIESLEAHFFSLDPFYFHLISVILHALNAVLVFYLIFALSKDKILSYICAILFGVHAVNTEAVAWAYQQSILWMTFFFLGGLLFFIKYIDTKNKLFSYCAIVLSALAIFTKDQMAIMSLLIFCTAFYKNSSIRQSLKLVNPFIWITILYFVARILSNTPFSQTALWDTRMNIFITSIKGFAYYIILSIYPHPLSVDYDKFVAIHAPSIIQAILILLATILFFFFFLRHNPLISLGIFWFYTSLAPVSNIGFIVNTIINERFLYIGSIGFIIFLVFSLKYTCDYITKKQRELSVYIILIFGALSYSIFLAFLTNNRLGDWHNELSLWKHEALVNPLSARTYMNLASAFHAEGKAREAIQTYGMAIQIGSIDVVPTSLKGILNMYLYIGDLRTATRIGNIFIKQHSDNEAVKYIFGKFLIKSKQYKQSSILWSELTLKNGGVDIPIFYEFLSQTLLNNRVSENNKLLDKINDPTIRDTLHQVLNARLLLEQNNIEESVAILEEILQNRTSKYQISDPYEWLAEGYRRIGKKDRAIATYMALLQSSPGIADYKLEIKNILNENKTTPEFDPE